MAAIGIVRTTMLLALSALVSCAGSGGAPARDAPRRVTPADFRGEAPVRPTAAPQHALAPAPLTFAKPLTRDEARGGVDEGVVTIAGGPGGQATISPAAPAQPGEEGPVVLDRIVGRINGKPVLASVFLEPLDARLRAEAKGVSEAPNARASLRARERWEKEALQRIDERMRGLVQDELLLSEFRSSITPEQQQGVRYFLDQLREERFLELGGTEKTVESRLGEGLTFEEHIQALGDFEIRREQLRRIIERQSTVSRRDVEQFYRQNINLFRADPVARLRVIRVPLDDHEAAEEAERRLALGEPIEAVAADLSTWSASAEDPALRNTHRVEIPEGGYEEATFFGVESLNEAARGLSLHETTDRIDAAGSAWWLHLEDLGRTKDVSLYEAQLAIEKAISEQRERDATKEYFESLLEKSSTTDPEAMIRELMAFARERYLPPLEGGPS